MTLFHIQWVERQTHVMTSAIEVVKHIDFSFSIQTLINENDILQTTKQYECGVKERIHTTITRNIQIVTSIAVAADNNNLL